MKELDEFVKQYKAAMDQVEKDYKLFLELLDKQCPAPYLRLKTIEIFESLLLACNTLNRVRYQIHEMNMKVSEARANETAASSTKGKGKKKEEEQKDDTRATILKLYDFTDYHGKTRALYATKLRELIQNKFSSKWGFVEYEHFQELQQLCGVCLERVVD